MFFFVSFLLPLSYKSICCCLTLFVKMPHSPSLVSTNKNVNWMDSRFWVAYFLGHLVLRSTLWVIPGFPQEYAWTVVNVFSTCFFFYFFHWVKGTPFWGEDEGEYDHLTFWEQIDDERQYTPNRKALTVIPVLIFLLAAYDSHWKHFPTVINATCVTISLIAKSGFMHQKRIGGINKD